jgi:hypothetical protein
MLHSIVPTQEASLNPLTTASVSPALSPTLADQAWVVFSDQAPVWWARFLKNGFRHCFMIQHCGAGQGGAQGWWILDPYTQPPRMMRLPFPSDFDLPHWLHHQGLIVTRTTPLPLTACARWSRLSVFARSLGLGRLPLFTPWQLYRRLVAL